MELEKYWNSNYPESAGITLEKLRKLKPSESIHPLNTLQKIIKQQTYVGFAVLMVFLVLLFIFRQSMVTFVLAPINLYLLYFLFRSFQILQGANQIENHPNENILQKIKLQNSLIQNYVKSSEIVAVFLYPLSILAGMIITFLIIGDESPANLFNDRHLIFLTIAAVLAFVPVQYFFTRKMNKKTFGSHLDHLNEMIENLEKSKLS